MRDGTVPKRLFKYLRYRPKFFDELFLRITPPHEFNDPFEGVLSKESILHLLEKGSFETEEKRKDAINKFNSSWEKDGPISKINNYGVISLTAISDSLLMWAHYADEHKGILMEFDTTDSGTATHPFFEGEIDNTQNPPELLKIKANPVEYPSTGKRPFFKSSTMEQLYTHILFFLFSKSEEWKYEKEYRMILNYNKLADEARTPPEKHIVGNKVAITFPNKTLYFKKIPEEIISAIYIGCRAENKDEIIDNFKEARAKNPKLEHVRIFESILDDNEFKVNYREIHSL